MLVEITSELQFFFAQLDTYPRDFICFVKAINYMMYIIFLIDIRLKSNCILKLSTIL